MTELKEIDENNWLQAAQLKVAEKQKFFCGPIYRDSGKRICVSRGQSKSICHI